MCIINLSAVPVLLSHRNGFVSLTLTPSIAHTIRDVRRCMRRLFQFAGPEQAPSSMSLSLHDSCLLCQC